MFTRNGSRTAGLSSLSIHSIFCLINFAFISFTSSKDESSKKLILNLYDFSGIGSVVTVVVIGREGLTLTVEVTNGFGADDVVVCVFSSFTDEVVCVVFGIILLLNEIASTFLLSDIFSAVDVLILVVLTSDSSVFIFVVLVVEALIVVSVISSTLVVFTAVDDGFSVVVVWDIAVITEGSS